MRRRSSSAERAYRQFSILSAPITPYLANKLTISKTLHPPIQPARHVSIAYKSLVSRSVTVHTDASASASDRPPSRFLRDAVQPWLQVYKSRTLHRLIFCLCFQSKDPTCSAPFTPSTLPCFTSLLSFCFWLLARLRQLHSLQAPSHRHHPQRPHLQPPAGPFPPAQSPKPAQPPSSSPRPPPIQPPSPACRSQLA